MTTFIFTFQSLFSRGSTAIYYHAKYWIYAVKDGLMRLIFTPLLF